jgi:DNA (cytosine-5)-methyltransferase 1
MNDRRSKYSLLSLYTGAGGLDQGFEKTSRFKTLVCVEKQRQFAATLRTNQPNGFVPHANILEKAVEELDPHCVMSKHFNGLSPDGIIGGPPCQAYSVRGKRLGLEDARSNETFRFLEWVVSLRPRFFLMENVPRMLKIQDGEVLKRIRLVSESAGYSVSHKVLSAADYGSATRRQRVFIVGLLRGPLFSFPRQTHKEQVQSLNGYKPHVASGTALAGLPVPGFEADGVPQGHIAVRHTAVVRERFRGLLPGQQDNVRKRTRLDAGKPSPTLVAGNLEQTRSHIHPVEPRELTNRESARIHGFSDDFVFSGNHAAMGVQIANSVPIPLARALAEAIATHLDGLCNPAYREKENDKHAGRTR